MVNPHAPDPERIARVTSVFTANANGSEHSLCASSADVAAVDGAGVVLILHGRGSGRFVRPIRSSRRSRRCSTAWAKVRVSKRSPPERRC